MENADLKYQQLQQEFDDYKKEQERFVHIVVHDLDSPLRKLSTFVDRFVQKTKTVEDPQLIDYIRRMENSINDLRSLIDALQHLSNVGMDHFEVGKCDLNKIIRSAIDLSENELAGKNVSFEINELPVLKGNKNQYLLLFKNLFDNSIKFSRSETPLKITVAGEPVMEKEKNSMHLQLQTNYFRLVVTDNGIGFKHSHNEDIFKPFFRLHSKSEIPGNGLGLSICKKIVENHNGLIFAEPLENSGARFVLILPESPQEYATPK